MNALPRGLLATLGVLLGGLMVGGGWFYRSQEAQVRRNVQAELTSIGALKARQIEVWRTEREGDGETLAHNPIFVDELARWMAHPNPAMVGKILTAFRALAKGYTYQDVKLVDARGQVRLSVTGQPLELPEVTRQTLGAARQQRRPVITDLHSHPEDLSVRCEVVVPLFGGEDATGEFLGTIVLEIDAREFIYPVTQSWPTPTRTAETLFVRRDGDAVLFLNALRQDPHAAFKRRTPLTRRDVPAVMAVLGQRGFMEGVDYTGATVLAAMIEIPNSPWVMVAKIEKAEALAEWRLRAVLIIAVLLLTGAGLAGTTVIIWQQRSKYHALAELTESLRRHRELLDETGRLARVGGWELHLANPKLEWTREVRRIHEVDDNYQPDVAAAVGFFAPEAAPVLADAMRRAREGGEPFDLEAPLITAEGNRLWVRAIGRPYQENGQTVRISGVYQDVTARKLLEAGQRKLLADLKRSNEELEQFAYVASHDLQEPLRMVASYTQLLAQRYQGRLDQDADDFIGFAVDGATRMQRLINDLLMYSRIGHRDDPPGPVASQAACADAIRNLALTIEDAGAVITHDPLPELPGDAGQLVQLFQNLIGNAIKFRQPGVPPQVHVSARREADQWIFSVADNGIGVAPQYHERIFMIFQRLHSRKKYSGTGIGLALCRRIVERHGGRLWLESAEGQGATFFFTLPA